MLVRVLVLMSVLDVAVQVSRRVEVKNCQKQPEFELRGSLNIALVVKECDHNELILAKSTVHSAIWVVQHLNHLNYTGALKLGISTFTACLERTYLGAFFRVFQQSAERVYLGVITDQQLQQRVDSFRKVLDLEHEVSTRYWDLLMKVSVKLLSALELKENVTVLAPNREVLDGFYRNTRKELICVKRGVLFE